MGYFPGGVTALRLRGSHPLWPAFQDRSPMPALHTPPVRQNQYGKSHNPAHATPAGYHTWKRFSLIRVRSPLLTESLLFSLPAGTEMFHFPAFPPRTLCVQVRVTAHDDCRVSPFGHPRITAWLTAPRGLSRPPTSFIGSWCQGIHRAPLKTWPQMLASTVQFSSNDQSPVSHAFASSTGPVDRRNLFIPSGPNSVPGPTTPRSRSTPKQY